MRVEVDFDVVFVRQKKKLFEVVEYVERALVVEALRRAGGSLSRASRLLGIPRQTLMYKVQKYHLEVARWQKSG